MNSLYNAMESLLASEETVNSLIDIVNAMSSCATEEKEKIAFALWNVTASVLKDVSSSQRRALDIIDKYLADNAKDNR